VITEKVMYKITYLSFLLNIIGILCFSYLDETIWISNYIFVIFCLVSIIYIFLFKRNFKFGLFHFYYFVLLAWMLLTCLWSLDIEIALQRFWTICQLTIYSLLTYEFFEDKGLSACEHILKAIFFSGVFMGLYSIAVYTPSNFIAAVITGERLGTEINQINIFGMNSAITVILGLYFYLKNKRIYLLGSGIGLLCALSSGSRKALLIVVLGVLLLYIASYGWRSISRMLCPVLFLGLFYALANDYIEGKSIFDRFESFVNLFTGEGKVDNSTLIRQQMIEFGLTSFMERPLHGYGLNNFSVLYMNFSGEATYAHNNYVEILVSIGLIGFFLYYWIYAVVLFNFRYLLRLKKYLTKEDNLMYSVLFCLILIKLLMDFAWVSYYEKMTYTYFVLFYLAKFNYVASERGVLFNNAERH